MPQTLLARRGRGSAAPLLLFVSNREKETRHLCVRDENIIGEVERKKVGKEQAPLTHVRVVVDTPLSLCRIVYNRNA